MTRSLQILQIIFVRRALLLGVSSAFMGMLIVLILTPASTSAISLPVKLDARLPVAAPLGAQAEVSLLDRPSRTVARVSAGVTTPAGAVTPPAAQLPNPVAPPIANSPTPIRPNPSQAKSATPLNTTTPVASGSTEPAVTAQTATTSSPTPRAQALTIATPEAFDFMPNIFSGDNKDYTMALVVITTVATLFLGFAAYTTTRLARGSPLP